MVTTDSVKRALAALAARTDTARDPYGAIIAEGDAAREDLERAAGFVEAVGLDRLETAIDAAAEADDEALATRGREVLGTYRAYRRAAAADHFHCGDGTPKCETDQSMAE